MSRINYNEFINKVSKCAKCAVPPREGKKSHAAYYLSNGAKVEPFVWNKKSVNPDDIVGYCPNCRPSTKQTVTTTTHSVSDNRLPTRDSSEGEKLKWARSLALKVSAEIYEVFGEHVPLIELAKRSNEWLKKQQSVAP